MEMVSGLYPGLLDRKLPLWRSYLIEGLSGGRFALVYQGPSCLRRRYQRCADDLRFTQREAEGRANRTAMGAGAAVGRCGLGQQGAPSNSLLVRAWRGWLKKARQNVARWATWPVNFIRIGARALGQGDSRGLATPLSARKTSLDKQFASGARSFACGSFPHGGDAHHRQILWRHYQ